jgi:hypothetical protein
MNHHYSRRVTILLAFVAILASAESRGDDPSKLLHATVTKRLRAGETVSLWYGLNVSGKLNLTIGTRAGANKMRLWWIKQPFGRVTALPETTSHDHFSIDIPVGVLRAAYSAELRGTALEDTVVVIGENVEVALKVSVDF